MRSLYLPPRAFEFACHSEACAPPNRKGTGGTGGSLKENDGRNRGRAPHSKGQMGRPLPPPKGLAPPKARSTNRKLAPHSTGEGRPLTKFPAPTGPNRDKEFKQKRNDAAAEKRRLIYEAMKKEEDRSWDERHKPMREAREAREAAEKAAAAKPAASKKPIKPEDAVADVEGYRAELKKRQEDLQARVAKKEAEKKEAEAKAKSPEEVAKRVKERVEKHFAARAAARAKK